MEDNQFKSKVKTMMKDQEGVGAISEFTISMIARCTKLFLADLVAATLGKGTVGEEDCRNSARRKRTRTQDEDGDGHVDIRTPKLNRGKSKRGTSANTRNIDIEDIRKATHRDDRFDFLRPILEPEPGGSGAGIGGSSSQHKKKRRATARAMGGKGQGGGGSAAALAAAGGRVGGSAALADAAGAFPLAPQVANGIAVGEIAAAPKALRRSLVEKLGVEAKVVLGGGEGPGGRQTLEDEDSDYDS